MRTICFTCIADAWQSATDQLEVILGGQCNFTGLWFVDLQDCILNISFSLIIFSDRIFSRILTIPFKEVEMTEHNLIDRLLIKDDLDEKMAQSIKSCGVILELHHIFDGMLNDPVSREIQPLIPPTMDMRSQENYFLLIYTVCKVLIAKYIIKLMVNTSSPVSTASLLLHPSVTFIFIIILLLLLLLLCSHYYYYYYYYVLT